MQRFPVLKALSGSQKVFKLGPFAMDKRQGFIMLGAVFGYWLLYKQIAKLVPLSTFQAAALFAPLLLLAFVLAFVKYDGRHLDWWLQMKWRSHMRSKRLLWKRRHPCSRRPLRDSIQEALPAERILWEMLRCKDGTYVLVFKVEPVSLSLAGNVQKEQVWGANAQLYNRIDFPVIEMSRSREGNVTAYTETLKEHVLTQVNAEMEPDLAIFSRQHLQFLSHIVPAYSVYDRSGYIILPYKPPKPDQRSRHKRQGLTRKFLASLLGEKAKKKPKENDAVRLQKEAEAAYRELSNRAEIVYDAFDRIGAKLRVLTDVELLEFLKGQTSGEEGGPTPTLFEPVTLEVGGYGQLSPQQLKNVLAAAERVREQAPPAMGIGDLTLADRISPDAVKIHDDYLRVGERYHATLFVFDYPPDVGFGELQNLLHIPGRVKIVKYVTPLPQQKAVERLGSKVAELQAAEYTASDGNVISTNQRAIQRYSAEHAMNELLTGEQGYMDISILIHCEADSKDDLHSLVESVRTKLAALRFEAKLARMEAWEGFVSTLPLGHNLLTERYANKGHLTHASACFFIYGSYQVNHPDGILLGIDPVSGGLVVLDSRELMNPHMVMLGTSGGGKTQTVKAMSSRLRMRGHRVVIIDPVGDSKYGPVARALNGEYVVFSSGSPHKFNPCDLSGGYLNLQLLSTVTDEDDPDEARRKAQAGALDGKISSLTRLVSLMISDDSGKGGLSAGDAGLVEKLWYEVYAEKGVTQDPDTHVHEPPTFQDFFRHMARVEDLSHVREQLYPWEQGTLKTFFDSQTSVDLDNKYLVFQIAGVTGREKAAIMYALLDFLNGLLSNPDELSDMFIDEFWAMLKFEMAASFSEEMFRSGRARNNAMVAITQDVEEFVDSKSGQVILRIAATHLVLKQRKKTVQVLHNFYDFSDEQRQQVLNFSSGQGYLWVEENQIPLYVICSEFENRLFNTDAKKEIAYKKAERDEERRQIEAGVGEPELPAREDYKSLPAATVRQLSGAGRIRQALSDDDDYVPRHDDYESVPTHKNGALPQPAPTSEPPIRELETRGHDDHRENGNHDSWQGQGVYNHRRPAEDVLHLSVPRAKETPIFAVVGPPAGTVAYNLAGMFARAGKDQGRNVVLVDADGYVTERILNSIPHRPPDEAINVSSLNDLVAHDPDSNLRVLFAPQHDGLPGAGVIKLAASQSDLIVVACGFSPYARDWLLAAHKVIATDTEARSLAGILKRAEEIRGSNGTLLAPMGHPKLTPELMSHPVFRLPSQRSAAFEEAEQRQTFASLTDAQVGEAFRPLLEELLQSTRKELV